MGFADYANYEPEVLRRFTSFTAAIGSLHALPLAGYPLEDRLDILKRFYDSQAVEVLQYKHDVRHSYGYGCPYCGEYCSTPDIDHYLPRSIYGEFSLFSWNLVPSCSMCNRILSNRLAGAFDFIYPFGDNFLSGCLCRVHFDWIDGTPRVSLTTADIAQGVKDRVDRHIEMLELSERFAFFTASQLVMLRRAGRQNGDLEILRRELREGASHYETIVGPNGWFALLYNALATDEQVLRWLTRPAEPNESA